MTTPVRIFAPAKINLFLHVTGKKADGYHTLSSFVIFSDTFGDEIIIEDNDGFSLELDKNSPISVPLENNLIEKAAKALAYHLDKDLNIRIKLKKYIPVGAGLGGGSTNAAHTIKALLKFWAVKDLGDLSSLLLSLGADVPVCYHTNPCMMRGIGEDISPYPYRLPQFHLDILTSKKSLLTKDIFNAFDGNFAQDLTIEDIPQWSSSGDMIDWLKDMTSNSLEDPALKTLPSLKDHLPEEKNGLLRMSGSGPTFFHLKET